MLVVGALLNGSQATAARDPSEDELQPHGAVTTRFDALETRFADTGARLGEVRRGIGEIATSLHLLVALLATTLVLGSAALLLAWRRLTAAEADIKLLKQVRMRAHIVQR